MVLFFLNLGFLLELPYFSSLMLLCSIMCRKNYRKRKVNIWLILSIFFLFYQTWIFLTFIFVISKKPVFFKINRFLRCLLFDVFFCKIFKYASIIIIFWSSIHRVILRHVAYFRFSQRTANQNKKAFVFHLFYYSQVFIFIKNPSDEPVSSLNFIRSRLFSTKISRSICETDFEKSRVIEFVVKAAYGDRICGFASIPAWQCRVRIAKLLLFLLMTEEVFGVFDRAGQTIFFLSGEHLTLAFIKMWTKI